MTMALATLLTTLLFFSQPGLSVASIFGVVNGRSTLARRTNRSCLSTVESLRGGATDGNKIDGPCIGIDLGKWLVI